MRKYLERPITDSPPNETAMGSRERSQANSGSQPRRPPSPTSSIMTMSVFGDGLASGVPSIHRAHQIPSTPPTRQQRDYGEEMASIIKGFTAHHLPSNPSTRAQSIRTVSSRTTAPSTRQRLPPPLPTATPPLTSFLSTGSGTPVVLPGVNTAGTNSVRANSVRANSARADSSRQGRAESESPSVSTPVPSNAAHGGIPASLLRERLNALASQIMVTQAPSIRSQQDTNAAPSIRIPAIPIRASPHRNQTVSGTSRTPSIASFRSSSRNSSQRASSAQSSASSVYHSALSTPLPPQTTHSQNNVAHSSNPSNASLQSMASTRPPTPSIRLPNPSGRSTASSIRPAVPAVPSVHLAVPSVHSAVPTIRPSLPSIRSAVSIVRPTGSGSLSTSASITHSPTPSMHTAVSTMRPSLPSIRSAVSMVRPSGSGSSSASASITHSPTSSMHTAIATMRPPLPSIRLATQSIHTVAPSVHSTTSIRPPLPSLHSIPLSIRPTLPSLHSAPPSIYPVPSPVSIPAPTAPSAVIPPPSVHSVAPSACPATQTPAVVNLPAAAPSASDPPPPSQDSSPPPPVDNPPPPAISHHSTPEEDSEPPPPVDIHTPAGGSSSSPGAAVSSSGNGIHLPAVAVSASWLVAANNLALTVLVAIFTNDCLFDKVYDAQIARHVFVLPWLILLAYCLRPGNKLENYFKLPESPTVTSVLIGIVYVMVMMCFFSNSILDVLQKGGAGIDYAAVGESCRPPFVRPRVLFLIFLILNSLTGATGIMWLLVSFGWVGD